MNWANSSSNNGDGTQKSLAEIQAEEQRQERERQERERREKKARQKDLSLAQASVWGSASSNLSWASKAAPITAPQTTIPVSGGGFWDEPPAPKPQQQQQQQQQPPIQMSQQQQPLQQQQTPQPSKKNKKNNKAKEEIKVAAIFKESKGKPDNEFEEWCLSSLDKLNPQVDIPTFLSFLNDVESPYEVCKIGMDC